MINISCSSPINEAGKEIKINLEQVYNSLNTYRFLFQLRLAGSTDIPGFRSVLLKHTKHYGNSEK